MKWMIGGCDSGLEMGVWGRAQRGMSFCCSGAGFANEVFLGHSACFHKLIFKHILKITKRKLILKSVVT